MPSNDTLTPMEAAYIATNVYFVLKDWITGKPKPGMETRLNVQNSVLGAGVSQPNRANPTLQSTSLASAGLGPMFEGITGVSTASGFGYVLNFRSGARRHAVIATRGTRPEMGFSDIFTDLRGSLTGFGSYGLVHKGFKRTFESIVQNLAGGNRQVMDADVVHCVGHSLGGGVATLLAAHYRAQGKAVKLYTFGCPRVCAGGAYAIMQREVGKHNVFRVAHDLDPITLIGPYPYIHLNPSPDDPNFMTLRSPTGQLFSFANHDMNEYISSVGVLPWADVALGSKQVDYDNAVLARWLLHQDNDPGWVQYASAKTLGLLFKLFSHVLRNASQSLILGLTAVDLLAEMLVTGLYRTAALAGEVYQLLRYAAQWAGIKIAAGADFTASIIRRLLEVMLARLKDFAQLALSKLTHGVVVMPLAIGGAWALAGAMQL